VKCYIELVKKNLNTQAFILREYFIIMSVQASAHCEEVAGNRFHPQNQGHQCNKDNFIIRISTFHSKINPTCITLALNSKHRPLKLLYFLFHTEISPTFLLSISHGCLKQIIHCLTLLNR
jgi:hypothetical protein